jgi:putative transposase
MTMENSVLRFRYRAYPALLERHALNRTFGCCRVVKNDAIALRQSAWKTGEPYISLGELQKRLITEAKKYPRREWLGEVSAVPLQQALSDVDRAYRNFFASRKGERKGPKMGPPRFASQRDKRQSARFTKNARFSIEVTGERRAVLTLPRVGRIPFVLSRPLPTEPSSVTVLREADGRTYVSFVVEPKDREPSPIGRACGIDAGLSSLATVCSRDAKEAKSYEKVPTPAHVRRRARALARSQRSLSRKKPGSKNREKARRRVAVQHRKVREARLDYAHQRAAQIVNAHGIICVEDLSVASMAKSRRLARSVHDQAMSQFLRVLGEKTAREGRRFVKVGRTFASTQICSVCDAVNWSQGPRPTRSPSLDLLRMRCVPRPGRERRRQHPRRGVASARNLRAPSSRRRRTDGDAKRLWS